MLRICDCGESDNGVAVRGICDDFSGVLGFRHGYFLITEKRHLVSFNQNRCGKRSDRIVRPMAEVIQVWRLIDDLNDRILVRFQSVSERCRDGLQLN